MSDKTKDTTPKNLNLCQEMLEQEKQNAFAHGVAWVTYDRERKAFQLLYADGHCEYVPGSGEWKGTSHGHEPQE